MAQSTDAILFYGYCWTAEADWPWEIGRDDVDEAHDEETWQERYVRLAAARTRRGPGRASRRSRPARRSPDWNEVNRLALASGCEVSTHCSSSCPMPLVAVIASLVRSHRGHPSEIRDLSIDLAWDRMLAEFCDVMGIRIDGVRAAWWLVSDWS